MKLGRNDIPKLEEYWNNYDHLKRQMKFRRFELLYTKPEDNSEGGKSNLPSQPTEQQAVKLSSDELYSNLKNIVETIETIYNNADDDERFIIQCRYFAHYIDIYNWEDIAHELTKQRGDDRIITRDTVLRRRNRIMRQTAQRIGWVSVI